MKKLLKILAIIFVSFVALVIILTLVVTFLVPWDKVKDKLVAEASKALKREVKIEKVNFNLFKGIEFKGFYIGNKEGFSKGAFISADSAIANYKFWALLKKQVILTKIELIRPHILIEKDKKGNFNFSDLMPSTPQMEKPEEIQKPVMKLPVELSISKFALNNGEVIYNDFELKKINILVSDISLETIKQFDFNISATLYYRKAPVDFSSTGKVEIKFQEQIIFLKNLSVKLTGASANCNIEVKKFMEEPSFKADLTTKLDSEKLVRLVNTFLSPKILAYMKELNVTGDGNFRLSMSGNITKSKKGKDITVTGEGDLDLNKIEIKYSTVFVKSRNFAMGLKYKFELNNNTVRIKGDIQTADSVIKTVNEIKDFNLSKINTTADADISLHEIFSCFPVMEDFESVGKVKLNTVVNLNLTKDYYIDYKSIKMKGKGNISDFGIKYKLFNYGISKLNSDISLTEKVMNLGNLTFNTGSSVFTGTLSVANFNLETISAWKEHFKGDVKIELTCQKFIVDEIMNAMPKKAESKEGKVTKKEEENPEFSNEEIKEKTKYISKDLKVNGKLNIKEIVYKKINTTDTKADIKLDNRVNNITATMNSYNGILKSSIKVDLNVAGLYYELSGDTSGVSINEFSNAVIDSFFSKVIADNINDRVYGTTQANFSIKGSGANKRNIKKNIAGNIDFRIINGKLKNWKILKDAFTAIKINPTDEIIFREFYGKLKIGEQKLKVDEFKVICDDAKYSVTGDIFFDKDMDSDMKLKMYNDFAPHIISRLGDISAYTSDENGWMPLDIGINCTIKSPCFAPLMERSLKNAENKLKKKAEEGLRKKGDELKKKGEDFIKNLFKK